MSLKDQLDAAYKRKVEENLEKTVRATALAVMTNIVVNTPVGNPDLWKSPPPKGYAGGRARNNWNADINTVDASITDQVNPNATGTEKITAALVSYKLSDTINISNNLPYIRRLNEGHSKQAPANFVEKAVMVGKRQGKEIAKRGFNK